MQVYASGSNVYAGTNGGGLGISTDGGITFTNRATADGLGSDSVFGIYVSGSNIYAATQNGLSLSSDGGVSWANYTTANGLGDGCIDDVYVSNGMIYAASGGVSIAQEPQSVPGPLPLLGAGAALGWSRRLRRRVHAARCRQA